MCPSRRSDPSSDAARPQPASWLAWLAAPAAEYEDECLRSNRLRQAALVEALLAASRKGDLSTLLALLDPDIVLRADQVATKMGVAAEVRGAADVVTFARRAGGARPALVEASRGRSGCPAANHAWSSASPLAVTAKLGG